MIRRIRERRVFDRLARDGTRIRRATLWCSWCPDPDWNATYVAYSIGRAYGPAAARNRLRRRLRHLLREIDRRRSLPPGLLVIGARPAAIELTFEQLRSELTRLVDSLPTTTTTTTATTTTAAPTTSTTAPTTSTTTSTAPTATMATAADEPST